MKRI
jgi:hypothetical protein